MRKLNSFFIIGKYYLEILKSRERWSRQFHKVIHTRDSEPLIVNDGQCSLY